MASEHVEELPDELESWVADRAAADGTTRSEVVRRLIAAHRLLDEHSERLNGAEVDVDGAVDAPASAPTGEASAEGADALATRLREIGDRVAELEDDLDEKITDVRGRVVQIKRETDAKAPADHDHPELEARLAAGFENYEEILEYLTEITDEHDAKLDTVAGAVVDLRARVASLERDAAERAAVEDIRREANRLGIAEAACDACGGSVRLGLLDEPFCPHCESPFDGVEPKRGLFGSNRLTVGDPPALESGDESSGASSAGETREETIDELGGAFAAGGADDSDEDVGDSEVSDE